jgi:hypothetical protein
MKTVPTIGRCFGPSGPINSVTKFCRPLTIISSIACVFEGMIVSFRVSRIAAIPSTIAVRMAIVDSSGIQSGRIFSE